MFVDIATPDVGLWEADAVTLRGPTHVRTEVPARYFLTFRGGSRPRLPALKHFYSSALRFVHTTTVLSRPKPSTLIVSRLNHKMRLTSEGQRSQWAI